MKYLLAFAVLTSQVTSLCAQPGTLDTSFGTNGRALAMVTGNFSSGEAIAEQPDGKIIVAGATPGFALLARFNTDGTLDNGFGTNGITLTDVDASNDFVGSVAVQPDGKIIAGGVRFNAQAVGQAMVMRHLPNGSLDNSFGTAGIRTITFTGAGSSFIQGLALQPDGRIAACGERYTNGNWESFVLRLNTDGSTDNSFGIVQLDIVTTGDDNATDITLQDDGKVVVCGSVVSTNGGGMFVARMNSSGSFDSGFGTGGKLVLDIGDGGTDKGRSVRVQPDGKVLVCGVVDTDNGYRIGVARLLADGTLDNSFGSNGAVQVNLGVDDWATPSLALQPDGRIVIGSANNAGNPPRVKVIRLLPDGTLDPSFGTNGIGTSNATSGNNDETAVRTIFLQDGGIAVAGFVDTPNNIQVAVWKFRSGVNVGVEEVPESGSLRISPNPAEGLLTVHMPNNFDAGTLMVVRDMTGREVPVVISKAQGQAVFDATGLSSGAYTVSIFHGATMHSSRFIKP
jgi:uncharacterized delta-60 repeat protein